MTGSVVIFSLEECKYRCKKKAWNKLLTFNAFLQSYFILMCNSTTVEMILQQMKQKQTPERNGYTTCSWKWTAVCMLLSYTSKWSRDVEVHCIGCCKLVSVHFGIPTYTCFFLRTSFITCLCSFFNIIIVLIFAGILVIIFLCIL